MKRLINLMWRKLVSCGASSLRVENEPPFSSDKTGRGETELTLANHLMKTIAVKYYRIKDGVSFNPLEGIENLPSDKADEITEKEYLNDFTGKTICFGEGAIEKLETKFGYDKEKHNIIANRKEVFIFKDRYDHEVSVYAGKPSWNDPYLTNKSIELNRQSPFLQDY